MNLRDEFKEHLDVISDVVLRIGDGTLDVADLREALARSRQLTARIQELHNRAIGRPQPKLAP